MINYFNDMSYNLTSKHADISEQNTDLSSTYFLGSHYERYG